MACVLRISFASRATTFACAENMRSNNSGHRLQIGEIMSNNEITQFSYFYWKSDEKKADEKMTLFPDGICHLLRYYVMLLENASQDTIQSSSRLWTFELILFACFHLLIFHLYHNRYGECKNY